MTEHQGQSRPSTSVKVGAEPPPSPLPSRAYVEGRRQRKGSCRRFHHGVFCYAMLHVCRAMPRHSTPRLD